MVPFVNVSVLEYDAFLLWYKESFRGYHYEAIPAMNRTDVYNNKEERIRICYRYVEATGFDKYEEYYYIRLNDFNYWKRSIGESNSLRKR